MEHIKAVKRKSASNPLFVIFFTTFIDLLGFGILIPVIPLLLGDPKSQYYLLPHGLTVADGFVMLGFLTAVYPLAQFFATPILGELSDKYGRKKILLISLLGTCLSYILFAIGILTRNIPLLFFSRAFDGITGGNISVTQAAIADITTPENRAKNFGLIGAAFGLGFILGPYIGGKLSDPSLVSWFNASTPFWFAAILSAINIISVITIFSETLKNLKPSINIDWIRSIKNILRAYGEKNVRDLFITNFTFQAGFTFFTTFASVFFITKFGYNQGNIGDFFAYLGIWIAFTQVVITRHAIAMFSETQILKVSLVGTGIAICFYLVPTVWWGLLLVTPVFAMFNGLTQATITSLISRSVGHEVQGEILGVNSSVSALAQAIPPILSGYIAAKISTQTPILVAGIVMVLSGLFFLISHKDKK